MSFRTAGNSGDIRIWYLLDTSPRVLPGVESSDTVSLLNEG